MIHNVSIIGLGKLGASMVAGMASRGFNVIGVDINEKAVNALNQGLAPIQETGLEEMIHENKERISATLDFKEAVLKSDISFVIVPTPSNADGAFSIEYAARAFKAIGKALREKEGYHVIVLTSTVLPGSTRYGLLPILEEESGKQCGPDFGLCYSPEFIALGSVIRDFLNPDFYLVGEFDERSGAALESVNARVALNHAPSKRMSLENAELAKISVNSYVTMKISFANTLAELCEKIPGGDVDVVSDALGMDKRIGRRYLTGGFGFGGPCFPRDNVAMDYLGKLVGGNTDLLATNDAFNRSLSPRTVEKLSPYLKPGSTVAVLGLSYKPLSHVIEESPGVFLAHALAEQGYRVLGYDPLANGAARKALEGNATVLDSLEDCLEQADTFLLVNPDDIFKELTPSAFLSNKQSVTVVDFWRFMKGKLSDQPGIQYIPLGKCLDDDHAVDILRNAWSHSVQV